MGSVPGSAGTPASNHENDSSGRWRIPAQAGILASHDGEVVPGDSRPWGRHVSAASVALDVERPETGRSWSLSALTGNGGSTFFAAAMVVNASNFGFHMVMSRMLGPSVYGALGSLLGLINVATLAVGALQAVITQAVASHRPHGRSFANLALRGVMVKAGWAGVICFGGFAALSPVLEGYLHLSSPMPVVELGIYLALGVVTLLPMGVLMGRLRFTTVAAATLAGAAVRMTAGPLLVAAGTGLAGAVGASVLSGLVTLALLCWPLRSELGAGQSGESLVVHPGTALLGVLALSGMSAFTGVDTFLARHYLSASASGYYTAAATAARVALFMPGAIASLAFPRLAAHHGAGPEARKLLLQALLATAVLAGAAVAIISTFPHLVLNLLFGSRYYPGTAVMGLLAIAALWAGLASILIYFHLARRSWLAPAPWLAVLAAVVVIVAGAHTMVSIAWTMVAVTGGVTALLALGTAETPRKYLETTRSLGTAANLGVPDPLDEATVELSIVVPYYNPGPRLRSTVTRLAEVLEGEGASFEIIAVSDGSTDGSEMHLADLPPEVVRPVQLPVNQGKGQALRTGLALATGRYLGFIDADGDIPPAHVVDFLHIIQSEAPDIIIGSKRHPDSQVVYPPIRRMYSWGYQQLIRVLFHLSVRDTQTGLKFIRRDVLAEVLPRMVEKRFAFDLELLVVARHLGYRRVAEAPITIGERFGSTVSVRSVKNMLTDTLAIFYRLHFLKYYDNGHSSMNGGLTSETVTPATTRPSNSVPV